MRILVLTTFLLAATLLWAQQPFPTLTGERSDGSSVQLPAASKGRFLIVGMAYGQKAGPLLEEWYGPAYLRFVQKHGLFASEIDADVYFVPLFVGLNRTAYNGSMKRLREEADPDVAKRVVFVKEDADAVRDALGLKDKETPYIFVVDPQGRIIHREEGKFTEEKLDAIEVAVTD
ncbi:MAG: hypothetical protein JNL05_15650 [Flavobacteriales bacterium]|nr:hypothetical protein [Flavobacteriales bacterium]